MRAYRSTRGKGLLEPFLASWRHQRATALLPDRPNEPILDLACGSYPRFLVRLPHMRKTGVDLFDTTKKIENIECVACDLRQGLLPFADKSFGKVTVLAFFEHLPMETALKLAQEITRVLLPGGVLICTIPHQRGGLLLRALATLGLVSKEEIDEHCTFFTKTNLHNMLREAGFPPGNIQIGYFQAGLNMWARAEKPR